MAAPLTHDRELRTDAVDFSFGEIVNLHRDKEIVIQPEYQRLFRWSDEQKSRLIESILVDLPIPPIFLIENESGVLELIDGLQRISSVIQFISSQDIQRDPLRLSGCDLAPELNDKLYDELDLADRLRIKRSAIRAVIIRRRGNPFIKYELFKRLNTGGSLLSPQEIRNCSSRMVEGGDEFYNFIKALANDTNFRKAIERLPDTSLEQKGDEELVLRFFAIKNYIDGYHGNVQEWLDGYMEKVLFKKVDFSQDEERAHFEDVFRVICQKFGCDAFARYREGRPQGRLAPAYYEAVVGAVVKNPSALLNMERHQIQSALATVLESDSFREVTGPGANTIEKLHGRIQLVFDALFSGRVS